MFVFSLTEGFNTNNHTILSFSKMSCVPLGRQKSASDCMASIFESLELCHE